MCAGRGFNKYLLIGNTFLIPASLWNMVMRHTHALPENLADGVMGLLYGFTFGFYILGIVKARRDAGGRPAH